MKIDELNRQARSHYRRFYRLMAMAMVVMMMVVTGSVVLGDSVQNTLVLRVAERIGSTQTIISSGQGLLNDSILQQKELKDVHGYLMAEGFVSSEGRMLPVMVWGTDEDGLSAGQTLINETLSKEIGTAERVVVHLPSNNMVPSGSLFISQRYTTTMRLEVKGIKTTEEGGNRWLHNEQMRPMNVFVNRQELAEVMGVERRINLILSDEIITEEKFKACWTPAYSGLNTEVTEETEVTEGTVTEGTVTVCVTSERVFLPQRVVEALHPQEIYQAYFVNHISYPVAPKVPTAPVRTVPYSFVTATTQLTGDDAVLTDVAARRIGASIGDSIEMEYYVAKGMKKLETRTHRFVVKDIVPVSTFAGNELLKADFPGLSNVEKCTDWDSDLPIDLDKIEKEDEDYWYQYRQTPKAIVAWEAVKVDWSNAFGVATAVTLPATNGQWSAVNGLPLETMGVTVTSPREEAMQLAAGGTDFTSLFLALGFFILVSAVLLMLNPLLEMYHLRREELRMYELMGFSRGAVRKMLFREAVPVLLTASPLGVLAGCGYASLSLWLLSGAWRGATHTEDFMLYVNPPTVGVAWVAGLLISVGALWGAVTQHLGKRRAAMAVGKPRPTLTLWIASALFAVLLLLNFLLLHSMALFVVCGLLWILCAGWWGQWIILNPQSSIFSPQSNFTRMSLWWSALSAHLPRHRVAFWTLATGVFMVFAVGLNRPDADRSSSEATGGYALYAECRVPIQYDLNSPDVRRHLKLDGVGEQVRFLQMQKHREDEASCLNLNKVATPSVLAMEKAEMAAFGIDTAAFNASPIFPAVLDEESLMWSVMKSVGDTLQYVADDGSTVNVLIVGSYPMGVLHGNVLMLREHFSQLWPEESGSSVLMATDDVSEVLTTALADYGISAIPVSERLAQFLEVTDTYLSIFMALGGLGLLLGIFSLMVVLRKNLAARRQEIALYDTLGFRPRHIAHLLRRENMLPSLYAIVTGAVGSVISISASMSAVRMGTWLMAALLLLLILSITILFINYIINPQKITK